MTGHKTTAVFDLETVQDRELLDVEFPKEKFAPHMAHEIVAISLATFKRDPFPDDEVLEIRSLGSAKGSEREMLTAFVGYIQKEKPRIVGFNSRSFDVEVLKYRCFRHGIQFPAFYQCGTKWDSYRSRYSPDWNFDLMDFLSNYGASPKFSLDIASRAIGLPGKFGISGVDVGQYYQDGRQEEIRQYCETDVIATSAMMLRVMHLTGELSTKGFRKSASAFLDFLSKSSEEKPHVQEFLKLLDFERFTGVVSSLEENAGMSVISSNSNVTKFPSGMQQ